MSALPRFSDVAAGSAPALDVLTLALAAEFGPVDADAALRSLDELGAALAGRAGSPPDGPRGPLGPRASQGGALACAQLLGRDRGFTGERRRYDDPDNSMLDRVLTRRRGLPILLSVVYVEVARRAGIALDGVGLAGHFVVGQFGAEPPLLLDPFDGGARLDPANVPGPVRPWRPHAIATRILNNLVGSYERRGNLAGAIRAAEMRLELPAAEPLRSALSAELAGLRARLN